MYYSGVKINHSTSGHGLLTSYFTTSSVVDFRKRLMESPEDFEYKIEYFLNKEEAFAAECLKETPYLVAANSEKIYMINSIVFKNYRDIKKYLKHTYKLPLQVNDPMYKFEDAFFSNGGKYIFKKDYNKK